MAFPKPVGPGQCGMYRCSFFRGCDYAFARQTTFCQATKTRAPHYRGFVFMNDLKSEVIETLRQLGQSRTTQQILMKAALPACPPMAQLDAYAANKLHGVTAVELRLHIIYCDQCAREILLREQITDDLIEDESADLIKETYAAERAPAQRSPASRLSARQLSVMLAERKAFIMVSIAILLLLMILFIWSHSR